MSHRRAKRIRKMLKQLPGKNRILYQAIKRVVRQYKREKLPTLKEMHNADVHADIPDPKPTGIL